LPRGCETWIVREGYEGLVRGNVEGHHVKNFAPTLAGHVVTDADPSLIHNLRFGDGELLKDGTGDHQSGRSLKGRYIVRVGWDDVRGWFAEVRTTE
jgi:6-phosphofructokinase 1